MVLSTYMCLYLQMDALSAYAGKSFPSRPHLLLRLSGSSKAVEEGKTQVQHTSLKYGGEGLQVAAKEEGEKIWEARKGCLWAAMNIRPGASLWTTDVCVPVSRLADVVADTKQDIDHTGLKAPIVGHAGDGNFHCFIVLGGEGMSEVEKRKEFESASALHDRMVRRAQNSGGTCTGEHGVGSGKMKYLRGEFGEEGVEMMRLLKVTLDPKNILNPGKVLPPPLSNSTTRPLSSLFNSS
mmetsp:Transcript_20777/g.53590  ORF Transcript_20777/g.53590 Transcript_20777/m.53590 type:complete len:238 (-) Transcript_20777:323-1036(-)